MTLTSKEIINRTEQYGARNYLPLPVVISNAEVWNKIAWGSTSVS